MKSPSEIARDLDFYVMRYGGQKPNWFDGKSSSWFSVAEDIAYLVHLFKEILITERQRQERLVDILEKVAPFICSAKCPTVWVTAEGQKHSEICNEAQQVLKEVK